MDCKVAGRGEPSIAEHPGGLNPTGVHSPVIDGSNGRALCWSVEGDWEIMLHFPVTFPLLRRSRPKGQPNPSISLLILAPDEYDVGSRHLQSNPRRYPRTTHGTLQPSRQSGPAAASENSLDSTQKSHCNALPFAHVDILGGTSGPSVRVKPLKSLVPPKTVRACEGVKTGTDWGFRVFCNGLLLKINSHPPSERQLNIVGASYNVCNT